MTTRATRLIRSAAAGVAVLAPSLAVAQLDPRSILDRLDAERLDAGLEDVGPTSTSLRTPADDLRQPTGFGDVFRLGGSDTFARFDGGITALFPRSVYTPSRFGLVPTVPPGTHFSIGEPPTWLLRQYGIGAGGGTEGGSVDSPRRVRTRVDHRASSTGGGMEMGASREGADSEPSRRRSVRELLSSATRAARRSGR